MKKDFNDTNELTFSKKDVYGDPVNLSQPTIIIKNDDISYIDVFNYKNIAVEYDFETGSSALYLQKNENEYELLYDKSIKDNVENSCFYSKDSAYILTAYGNNQENIRTLDYFEKKDFMTFLEKYCNEPTNKFGKILSTFSYIPFMLKRSQRMIENNKRFDRFIKPEIFKEYKKLYIKYTVSTKLIPAYCILNSFITNIHNYIATKKLTTLRFDKNMIELQNFKDVCPKSTSTLNSFLKDPVQTDLHQVCDILEKNLNNIDKLIQIYLENELNIQKEGEKYDSK